MRDKDGIRTTLDKEPMKWYEILITAPFIILGMLGVLAISLVVLPFSVGEEMIKHLRGEK